MTSLSVSYAFSLFSFFLFFYSGVVYFYSGLLFAGLFSKERKKR